ncbi:MAG: hypothetical protein L7U23_10470 [Crocinitomicaceae bacterium]|jgi:hypothetical protein|nr:hypothetical protein [Crocinitomicaceae bacterium]
MNWTGYISLATLATIKFMFSAIPGPALGLNYVETVISIFVGAVISAAFFFFSAEYFMQRAQKKRIKLMQEAHKNGETIAQKRVFSRMNKGVVRLKLRFGKIGICFWAPFLLSVPVGSIIVAKFYGKYSFTFLYVILGMLINSLLTSFIVYVFV